MRSNAEIVFNELKSRKLIDSRIKLIQKNHTPNYKASITNDKIYYNPSFSNINKEGIRFILLHEIGHMQRFQISYVAILVSMIVSLFLYFLIISVFGPIYSSLIILVVFLIVFRLFIPLIKRDEFRADEWATRRILAGYKSKKPSLMMKQAWKDIFENDPKFNILRGILLVVSKLIQYHPSYEERVQHISSIENASK